MRRWRGGLVVAAGLALAGCGSGAAHVIGPGVQPTTSSPSSPSASQPAPSPATTAPSGVAGTAPTQPTSPTQPTGPAGSLTPAQVNQVDTELGEINDSINQASSDLSHPNQGDEGS